VFVRPIDLGLRIEPDRELGERTRADALRRYVSDPDGAKVSELPLRFPVAVDVDGRPVVSREPGKGGDLYAAPVAALLDVSSYDSGQRAEKLDSSGGAGSKVEFNDDPDAWDGRNHLLMRFDIDSDSLRQRDGVDYDEATLAELASQPGQLLVDSLGNVYRVLMVDQEATAAWIKGGGDRNRGLVVSIDPPVSESIIGPDRLGRIAFTPQVPAAVRVVTVRP